MKKRSNARIMRYGTVSLMLCILAVVCVIMLNVIAGVLCLRYDWMYVSMYTPAVYEISDPCREYIAEHIIPEVDRARAAGEPTEKIRVVFCDKGTENSSEDNYKYVYDSLSELSEMFEGYIEISHMNIWDEPGLAREYGVTSSEDMVCIFNERHQTVNINDFYISDESGSTVAYNGEKLIASCFMRVTQERTPVCYLTVNHGEVYGDYEFARMVTEAGYEIATLDLYNDEIPEDCELLVTFDPKKDLAVANETSLTSEVEKLERYMSIGGKYMVFASSDTFASGGFENLEGFLAEWGIKYMHDTLESGIEACRIVQDRANSLTTDGYTVLADKASSGIGAEALLGINTPNSFGNTTYLAVSNGFETDGKGNFVSSAAQRTAAPLFLARRTAIAWANGKAVARASDEELILMSLTRQECNNGEKAYLLASASVDFASEDAMKSSVIGNSRTLTEIIKFMGKENAPSMLVFKPFGQTEIESLTSRNANIITVILVGLPVVAVSLAGAVVLIRRRNR